MGASISVKGNDNNRDSYFSFCLPPFAGMDFTFNPVTIDSGQVGLDQPMVCYPPHSAKGFSLRESIADRYKTGTVGNT